MGEDGGRSGRAKTPSRHPTESKELPMGYRERKRQKVLREKRQSQRDQHLTLPPNISNFLIQLVQRVQLPEA